MEKTWEIRGDKIVSVTYFGNDGCGSDEIEIEVCTIQDKDYARRIVACVNACRDIDMTVLEMPNYSVKAELDTLDAQIAGRLKAESQRDELLAALTHAATDYIDQNGSVPSWWTDKIRQMVKDTTRS